VTNFHGTSCCLGIMERADFICFAAAMLNTLFNMKKVGVREIVHGFSKLHKSLNPGQSVDITSHGQPIGQYIKRPCPPRQNAELLQGCLQRWLRPEVGDAILKRLLAEEE